MTISKISGVSYASLAKVNGIAKASFAFVNGVAPAAAGGADLSLNFLTATIGSDGAPVAD